MNLHQPKILLHAIPLTTRQGGPIWSKLHLRKLSARPGSYIQLRYERTPQAHHGSPGMSLLSALKKKQDRCPQGLRFITSIERPPKSGRKSNRCPLHCRQLICDRRPWWVRKIRVPPSSFARSTMHPNSGTCHTTQKRGTSLSRPLHRLHRQHCEQVPSETKGCLPW